MIENKEFYLPLGGNPPTYAWEQSSYYNPNEIRPISAKYITEYISSKINSTKNAIAGFFNNIFNKSQLEQQKAGIINKIEPYIENTDSESESRLYLSRPSLDEKLVIEPNKLDDSNNKKTQEINKIPEIPEIIKIENIEEISSVISIEPPLGLPFFYRWRCAIN